MQVGRLEIVKLFFKHLNNLLISSFKEEQYKKKTHTHYNILTHSLCTLHCFFFVVYIIYIYIYIVSFLYL